MNCLRTLYILLKKSIFSQRNPLELLRKVNAVKDEYKALVQEAAEIQKAQTVSMNTASVSVAMGSLSLYSS